VGRGARRVSARVHRRLAAALVLLASSSVTGRALAHEYWLDPFDATLATGELLAATVRNGQEFVGTTFPYDPNRMARLDLVAPDGTRPVPARLGDFPAVQVTVEQPGLHLVVLDTYPRPLVYEELDSFAEFLAYHGQEGILEAHAARGLPETDIAERYYRHVKLLVSVSEQAVPVAEPAGTERESADVDAAADGVDAPQGQALELVPENDPYREDTLQLQLLTDGEPFANAQIELFERTPRGEVTRTLVRSDAEGRARFDVARPGEYLVNAVRVTEAAGPPLDDESERPHWQSRWASLTFEKP